MGLICETFSYDKAYSPFPVIIPTLTVLAITENRVSHQISPSHTNRLADKSEGCLSLFARLHLSKCVWVPNADRFT